MLKKSWFFLIAGIAVLVFSGYILFSKKRIGPIPLCHRAFEITVSMYMGEGSTDYPNMKGDGDAFLAVPEMAVDPNIKNYAYISGLKEDDPESLILFYMKVPTRYRAHSDRPMYIQSLFREPLYMTIAPGFPRGNTNNPRVGLESGMLFESLELKKHLQMTLDFLEKQNRPYWQEVRVEHQPFIDSLP